MKSFTVSELADMLRAAANAHHAYEQSIGHPDENWPSWYAAWIFMQEHSEGPK